MEEFKNSGGEEWKAIIADPDSMHGDLILMLLQILFMQLLKRLLREPGKTVVAFCHAMVTMCFLQKMLGYDDNRHKI
ncbi:MAG: hypothetical protein Ct9H90mP5_04150 [Acidimicrobiaceae bacterium]|nr:MAG: hypothetical protein Ct9H90mP5_04150 [Acidimicrobiaceae bacterium]